MLFYFDCIHKSRDCAMSSTIFKLLQFKVNVEIKVTLTSHHTHDQCLHQRIHRTVQDLGSLDPCCIALLSLTIKHPNQPDIVNVYQHFLVKIISPF